jgi:hypothetical protein
MDEEKLPNVLSKKDWVESIKLIHAKERMEMLAEGIEYQIKKNALVPLEWVVEYNELVIEYSINLEREK